MNRSPAFLTRLLGSVGIAALWLLGASLHAAERKPNVLVFYLDDMGWGEPGCYGGRLAPTPHMDALATGGVRFTQGYSSACVCSPGRVGLITGRYQARTGHDSNTTRSGTELALSEVTLAQRLQQVGYKTGLIGKWHLGHTPEAFMPQNRGFDWSLGSLGNVTKKGGKAEEPMYFRGNELLPNLPGSPVNSPVYAKEACSFVEQNQEQPWFLLLSFNAVHHPFAASPEWVAKFQNLPPEKQHYAALIAEADASIGMVLTKLRELGQEDDTLIFLLSDNGIANTDNDNGGLRGSKWFLWEGGIRVSWIASWKGRFPAGRVLDDPVIQLDIAPTALAAAGASIQPDWQLDGVNLLPLLQGQQKSLDPRALYFRFGVQYAIRSGDWKLVKASSAMEPMLVHLATDPGETKDLSTQDPGKRDELQHLFETWNATMQPPRWEDGRWNGIQKTQATAPPSPKPALPVAASKPSPRASQAPSPATPSALPRVLLIGDSISYGYEKHVRKQLAGQAEVLRNTGNAEYTGNGIKHLDAWLGDGRWDVIHFNWGLWDLYGWRYHAVDRSPAAYEARLETLVSRLEKTGAKLIWATTTPACPAPERTMRERFQKYVQISPELQNEYAQAALRVMQKHSVTINDLHALMRPQLRNYQIAEDNVHFTDAGSQFLADQVSRVILEALR
jgi:arylsulfatase A-like enzyme/lysophospholipase L1-like esterase